MKYLEQDFTDVGLTKYYSEKLEPHKHVTWEGDFMGMCQHDIACQVCFDASAIITKDVCVFSTRSPDKHWSVQPCRSCQTKGYRTLKLPNWFLKLIGER